MTNELSNGTNNENLPPANVMGAGDDAQDSGMPDAHLLMNGMHTASVPIPFQRMQTDNQQQQQQQAQQQAQQQQMLLFQQQQQQA